MALPQNYLTQSMSTNPRVWWWLEVSGLPYAYGNFSGSSTLFAQRSFINARHLGVKPLMIDTPRGFSQQIDPISAESSLSSVNIKLLDHDAKSNQDSQLTKAFGLSHNRTFLNTQTAGKAIGASFYYNNSSGSVTNEVRSSDTLNANYVTPNTPIVPSYASYVAALTFSSSHDTTNLFPATNGVVYVSNEGLSYTSRIVEQRSQGYQTTFVICKRAFYTNYLNVPTGSLAAEPLYSYQQETLFPGASGSWYVSASTYFKGPFNPFARNIYANTMGYQSIQTIGSRLCTLYSYLSSSQPTTSAELTSGSIIRHRGFISSIQQLEGGVGYDLKIDSVDRKIAGFIGKDKTKKIFSNQIKTKLRYGIAYSDGKLSEFDDETDEDKIKPLTIFSPAGMLQPHSKYNTSVLVVEKSTISAILDNPITNNGLAALNKTRYNKKVFFVRIDKEIFAVEYGFSAGTAEAPFTNLLLGPGNTVLYILKRGCFGTRVSMHEIGAEVAEVMPLVGTLNGTFISNAEDERVWLPLMKTDPASMMLNILTSTGNRNTNGSYDTFPEDWSISIPQTWIDIAEIETNIRRYLPTGVASIIDQPFEVLGWIREQVSKPFRLFPVNKLNGLFTLRLLESPNSRTTNIKNINHDDLIDTPRWDANLGSSIGEVAVEFNKQPDNKYGIKNVLLNVDTKTLYDGAYGSISMTSDLLRDQPNWDNESTYRFQSDSLAAGSQHISDLFSWYQAWWTVPRPIIDLKLKYEHHTVEPGDYLWLSSSIIPNEQGTLGVVSGTMFVISKKIDSTKGYVDLSCIDMQNTSNVRCIAPSIIILSASNLGSSGYRVYSHITSASCSPLSEEDDCSFFSVGDKVKIWRANLDLSSSLVHVTTVSSRSINISGSFGTLIPSAGCVVMYAPYEQSVSAQQSMYAYMANEQLQLISGSGGVYTTGSAHIHIP
jgi:hypothetical protein